MPSFLSPMLREPSGRWLLRNTDTGRVVASRLEVAADSATRRRGLLGRDSLPGDAAMIIAPCSSIHTFFMRFAIDVLFVSREGVVVKRRDAIPAWRISGAMKAWGVIELAAGAAARSGTEAGHRLVVEAAPASADVR